MKEHASFPGIASAERSADTYSYLLVSLRPESYGEQSQARPRAVSHDWYEPKLEVLVQSRQSEPATAQLSYSLRPPASVTVAPATRSRQRGQTGSQARARVGTQGFQVPRSAYVVG
jgi:hypothetical protein